MSDTDNSRRTFLALAAAVPSALAMTGVASAQTSTTSTQPGEMRGAIVTGSSRGIGASTARRLAREGFAVTVNYLTNRDLAEAVVRDIERAGGRAIVRQGDVADPAAVKALFDANDEAFGGVDVVVNNAGIMNVGPFAQMTDEAFDRMMATNVKGSFNVLREASRRVRDGGRIISLSSSIIKMSPPGTAAYAATKATQEVYSSVLRNWAAATSRSMRYRRAPSIPNSCDSTEKKRFAAYPRQPRSVGWASRRISPMS
jgi:3-oxoacyl-[acyl-carrier protein] reductase